MHIISREEYIEVKSKKEKNVKKITTDAKP